MKHQQALAALAQLRDPLTAQHQRRTAVLAEAIAIELALGRRQCLRWAALVHDTGKLSVPMATLAKQGAMCPEERARLLAHSQAGYEVLAALTSVNPR